MSTITGAAFMYAININGVDVTVTPVNEKTGLVRTKEGKYIGCVPMCAPTELVPVSPDFCALGTVVKMWILATGGN